MAVLQGHEESIVLSDGRLRCPHCEQIGRLPGDYKALDLNEKYKNDLNPVYKHLGCGHVFSPGDPQIVAAYVKGELVPRTAIASLEATVGELRELISELRAERRAA